MHKVFIIIFSLFASISCLKFDNDGYFKIVQFTDLHFGNDIPENDMKTIETQLKIIDIEQPALVIVSGDSVSSWVYPSKYLSSCLNILGGVGDCYSMSVQAMMNKTVPWAMTLGNHDREVLWWPASRVASLDMSYNLSLTQRGPDDVSGVTNYVLHVDGLHGLDLWFVDTGNKFCQGHDGYGCVEKSQIEWYKNTSRARLRAGTGSNFGLMVMHIPPPEVLSLANSDTHRIKGEYREHVCCPQYNTGLFAAVKEMDNVQTMIFGHDHHNDFHGKYDGVLLAYGRKSGHGCYGPASPSLVGARVLQYHETAAGVQLETWIRDYVGDRHDQVHSITRPYQTTCCPVMDMWKTIDNWIDNNLNF